MMVSLSGRGSRTWGLMAKEVFQKFRRFMIREIGSPWIRFCAAFWSHWRVLWGRVIFCERIVSGVCLAAWAVRICASRAGVLMLAFWKIWRSFAAQRRASLGRGLFVIWAVYRFLGSDKGGCGGRSPPRRRGGRGESPRNAWVGGKKAFAKRVKRAKQMRPTHAPPERQELL